jgi:Kef-type K+ transport system membrane component KefB
VAATLIAIGPLGWTTRASLIAGTALSTTSLAVVYAVLVETGLNTVRVGKADHERVLCDDARFA